jgi:hypothetical protein
MPFIGCIPAMYLLRLSACWAISMLPKKRYMMRLGLRCSNGRMMAYPRDGVRSFSIVSICRELFKENFQAIVCRLGCVDVRPVAEDERTLKAFGFAD